MKYPAGKSRFEPISVIIAACLMSICAVLVIQEAITRLVQGFGPDGVIVEVLFSSPAVIVIGIAVSTKDFLN